MKIEIDLDRIMGSEEEVRQEVIEEIASYFKGELIEGAYKRLDELIKTIAASEIKNHVQKIIEEGLDHTYSVINSYGERKGETTIRQTIIKEMTEQCVYTPKYYSSDENSFTKTIKNEVEKQLGNFKADFNRIIDDKFIQDCQNYAAEKLRERLKIKA